MLDHGNPRMPALPDLDIICPLNETRASKPFIYTTEFLALTDRHSNGSMCNPAMEMDFHSYRLKGL